MAHTADSSTKTSAKHNDDEKSADTADKPKAGIGSIVQTVMRQRPVRVFLQYAALRGPLMASGLAYQALFAAFAGLWVAFSIAALVIQGDIGLRDALIDAIGMSVPGLIDTGDGEGAIDPELLLNASILGWTGAVALVALLFTALGWLASAREAVRALFGLGALATNFLLLKLKDLGLAAGFGVALIISVVLSAATTNLIGYGLDLVGIGSDSLFATIVGRTVGYTVVLALDTLVLASLYRVLSGVRIPLKRLVHGALIGAVALGLLKALGGLLLGGSGNNPLLASFAVIIGLLIWFNLVCQVILISAAWIAVGMEDAGISADPVAEAKRIEEERKAKEAAEAAAQAAKPRGLARLFRRRRKTDGSD